jgi:hypothetical protein
MFHMSQNQDGPRFIFHGNAMPFGGRTEAINEKPHLELIKGPPAAALPVVGGWSIASSAGSSCHDWFKYGATVADCKGEWLGGQQYRTTVMSSIADVHIINNPHVFEASNIRIRMVSQHDGPDNPPHIVPTEIVFENMRLDGQPITVPYDNDLSRFPTLAEFEKEYQTDQNFFNKYQVCLKHPKGEARFGDPMPRTPGGFISTSFVRSVVWNGQTFQGNVLSLRGFGSIYFGESLLNADNRRITMVRLALGCDRQAAVVCAEADPNGNWSNYGAQSGRRSAAGPGSRLAAAAAPDGSSGPTVPAGPDVTSRRRLRQVGGHRARAMATNSSVGMALAFSPS